jgi:AAA+ ATPase superfamily predicted ATPase
MQAIIGREHEKHLLARVLDGSEAELLAVYGRRRVGKTFLIRNSFEKQLVFEFSGIHNATMQQQLQNFQKALSDASGVAMPAVTGWIEAFAMLEKYLTPKMRRKDVKRVIFFDEFPWIHTPKSGFLEAFTNFWNVWASRQTNLIAVICGSAASWMIQKVINDRGGLHNRVTKRIRLLPFTVAEAELYLKHKKVNLDRYQILQLYMVMGGVPQYLREIQPGESASVAIDRVCFTKDGFLHDEFKNLFHSLFDDATAHIQVIRALAKRGSGLTRNEIIRECGFRSGGGLTQLLQELEESGFIMSYIPFNRTAKDSVFKLSDEYARFYIRFVEGRKFHGRGSFNKFSTTPTYVSWSGNAFESICLKHVEHLKRALGIQAVHTESSVWRYRSESKSDAGAQIDLVIDRQDRCINICECKFSTSPFEISKSYAKELATKLRVFREQTQTRKTLFLTMISTYGTKNKDSYSGLVQAEISMDALFD